MGTVAVQAGIGPLLETAGARPRGNRHDCPKCDGLRTVTHTEECFYCHKCQWKGNVVTLQKELGIYERIPSVKYRELCRERNRAHEAAERLYAVTHQRQLTLRDDLRILGRLEQAAHEQGPDDPNTWEILSTVYELRPAIERDLDVLENGNPAALVRFLTADDAAEIRIRAERKWGQLYKEPGKKAKGARAGGKKEGPRGRITQPRDNAPTLTDMGIGKDQSSDWQKLAAVPEEVFEAHSGERNCHENASGTAR